MECRLTSLNPPKALLVPPRYPAPFRQSLKRWRCCTWPETNLINQSSEFLFVGCISCAARGANVVRKFFLFIIKIDCQGPLFLIFRSRSLENSRVCFCCQSLDLLLQVSLADMALTNAWQIALDVERMSTREDTPARAHQLAILLVTFS